MSDKFPVGSRAGGGTQGAPEVPVRVLGHVGPANAIVEALADGRGHFKGEVFLVPTASLTPREEVKHVRGEAEDENGPAIGWMEMGGLSVALTRDRDGVLLVSLERAVDHTSGRAVPIRVRQMPGTTDLWKGDIT